MPHVKEQVSLDYLYGDLLYTIGGLAVILIVLALGFIDMGLVRRKNVLDTWIQKLVSSLIAGGATVIVGYAIWQWSFNQAFGVPQPLWQAIKDWWIGGQFQTTFSGNIDPKVLPEADVLQLFVMFFATFSMATLALIHSGVPERLRPKPLYTMAFVIGLVLSPLVAYFCWGPVGPLTNRGTHDFDGIFPLYIFSGTWVLVLSWRLKPRLGALVPHPSGARPAAGNAGLVAAGVLLILFALPFVVLGSTFVIPETGVFGISFTNTGWGVIIINLIVSFSVGGAVGAWLAYRRREPLWALLGPLSGSVICGTLYDVGTPIEVAIVSAFGPLVALGTTKLVRRLGIDEPKVIPLALGPGIVGAIATGFIAWGTKTGGYPGLEGPYALQHAEITPWWQLAGVVAVVLIAAVPCLLMCLAFERFGKGLRVTEAEELAGMDATFWGVSNDEDELLDADYVPSAAADGARRRPPVVAGD
jgi:Amt family ammonium transporter